jgi:Microsomal signal peptidase 12 kDa subunit (SPC12)
MLNIQTHMVSGLIPSSERYFANFTFFQDFDGQCRAEKLSRFIITLFGIVGLVWGAIIQQFSQTVYILGAGFLLASIVSLLQVPQSDIADD